MRRKKNEYLGRFKCNVLADEWSRLVVYDVDKDKEVIIITGKNISIKNDDLQVRIKLKED